jgi:hypothetical protein
MDTKRSIFTTDFAIPSLNIYDSHRLNHSAFMAFFYLPIAFILGIIETLIAIYSKKAKIHDFSTLAVFREANIELQICLRTLLFWLDLSSAKTIIFDC